MMDGCWSQAQISIDIQTMAIILHLSCWFIDPQANVVPGIPETAICVQVIAAQYILQFAIVIALCCALHRSASRVIHRSEWLRSALNLSLLTSLYTRKTRVEESVQTLEAAWIYGRSRQNMLLLLTIAQATATVHVKWQTRTSSALVP